MKGSFAASLVHDRLPVFYKVSWLQLRLPQGNLILGHCLLLIYSLPSIGGLNQESFCSYMYLVNLSLCKLFQSRL